MEKGQAQSLNTTRIWMISSTRIPLSGKLDYLFPCTLFESIHFWRKSYSVCANLISTLEDVKRERLLVGQEESKPG